MKNSRSKSNGANGAKRKNKTQAKRERQIVEYSKEYQDGRERKLAGFDYITYWLPASGEDLDFALKSAHEQGLI